MFFMSISHLRFDPRPARWFGKSEGNTAAELWWQQKWIKKRVFWLSSSASRPCQTVLPTRTKLFAFTVDVKWVAPVLCRVSNTTYWPSAQLMQRALLPLATGRQHCCVWNRCNTECFTMKMNRMLRCLFDVWLPVCCVLNMAELMCSAPASSRNRSLVYLLQKWSGLLGGGYITQRSQWKYTHRLMWNAVV